MRIRARSTCRRVLSAVGCAVSITALPVAAQSIAVLHSFATQEQLPHGLIQASDGNFYGTTSYGGANGLGSVFKVTPTGTLTTLYSFRGVDGSFPQAHDLVQGVDGNLYGTTSRGGPGDDGTVFKITPEGILATLHSFNGVDGSFPNANLVQGTDGNFYGTTAFGGDRSISVNGYGTVFSIAPTGALTTLHSFSWGDGAIPGTGLVQGTDGRFYGTTSLGGANGHGTFFRMEPDGMLTTLRSFAVDAELPNDGLVKGADGSFYGTTTDRVFKITPTGTLTTIVFGLGPPGGNQSEGGIALGSDGDLYGTTSAGGDNVAGTVFKVTPDGLLTVLHSFAYDDGAFPRAGLVQGTDGSFYGTTTQGGTGGSGTVFKITPSGALTTLLSFAGSEGSDPYAGLLQGTDGNFYGTTTQGGTGGSGTVFKITPSGALTTLHSFTYCLQDHAVGGAHDASLVHRERRSKSACRPRSRNRRGLLWNDSLRWHELLRHGLQDHAVGGAYDPSQVHASGRGRSVCRPRSRNRRTLLRDDDRRRGLQIPPRHCLQDHAVGGAHDASLVHTERGSKSVGRPRSRNRRGLLRNDV